MVDRVAVAGVRMATDTMGEQGDWGEGPRPSRLRLPAGYGAAGLVEGLLPWSHTDERLAGARTYWIGTTLPDGTPHAVPVWGVWVDGRLYFGGSPETRMLRNLERNPAVVVHLESGDDVVILKGVAEVVTDRALLGRVGKVGAAKYGGGAEASGGTGDEGAGNGGEGGADHRVYAVVPHTAYAWNDFPKNATRWRFPG